MDINIDIPFRLNFNNLDSETQEKLMQRSRQEVGQKCGEDIKVYAEVNHLDYGILLEEEAIKNLYNHKIKFTVLYQLHPSKEPLKIHRFFCSHFSNRMNNHLQTKFSNYHCFP